MDRTLSLLRMDAGQTGTAWGGDQAEEYAPIDVEVPCRVEITDIETYTIWIMEDIAPVSGDRVSISGMNSTIDIIRVQPWTDAGGSFHHYEMTGKPAYPTRELVDAG
jgi:hypothetical protein